MLMSQKIQTISVGSTIGFILYSNTLEIPGVTLTLEGYMIVDWITATGFFSFVVIVGVLVYICRTKGCGS